MKRHLIVSVLACLSMSQVVHAQAITDLPDPDGQSVPVVQNNQGNSAQTAQAVQTSTVQREAISSIVINAISRKSGGELYRVDLARALNISRIDIRVAKSRLKISKAEAVTDRGQRILLRQLMSGALLETGSTLSSENINANIKFIEITGESYSQEADVSLSVVSVVGKTDLSLKRPVVVTAPVNSGASCSNTSGESTLKNILDQAEMWTQRANDSGGGIQEQFAAKQAEVYVQQVLNLLNTNNGSASPEYLQQLMNFFGQKYDAAPSGSRAENIYARLRNAFGDAYTRASTDKMNCQISRGASSAQLIAQIVDARAKYDAARSGSREEAVYAQLSNALRPLVIPTYQRELQSVNDFKVLEAAFYTNMDNYNRAPSGSFLESVYRDMGNVARARAMEVINRQAQSMGPETKYQMIVDYQRRYNAAPSGSAQESFARDVLQILNR